MVRERERETVEFPMYLLVCFALSSSGREGVLCGPTNMVSNVLTLTVSHVGPTHKMDLRMPLPLPLPLPVSGGRSAEFVLLIFVFVLLF